MMTGNQLIAEADGLPDLDEFEGMSVVDIAHAITLWPEGSEDQLRAIEAIRRRAPGRGHNRAPLDEALEEDLAPQRARAEQLLEIARTAVIIDDVSAAKVVDLVRMLFDLENDLDKDRLKRTKPYRDAQSLINTKVAAIIGPLTLARGGDDGKGLRGMLTRHDDKRKAEAEAERRRLREEQRQREEAAADARRIAEEKAAEGKGSVAAELDALKAQDEAERAAQRADAIRPEPIRSTLGQVTRRREITFKITDVRKALGWIIRQAGGASAAEQFARTWLGGYLRALGVETVAGGVEIPGAEITVEQGAANVRR